MNPGWFTALLVGLAEAGSCTKCFFCIPYVLSELYWGTDEHQHNVMFTETVPGFFQEFSCSIHRVVHYVRRWCWLRMVFVRLSSVSYLPGLAVPYHSLNAVCSSGKGVMTDRICRQLHRGFSLWNFWLASQWAGRPCTIYFQAGFGVSWFASIILNETGSVEVLHILRARGFGKNSPDITKYSQRQVLLSFPCAPCTSQSTFEIVALRTKSAVLHKACGIPSFLLSKD